ncbi:hypothetical protein B7494_g6143 [Chlorociboria aeruginascens]|nr:hypothetical protein B7494_g6143 [Chlorociboria aeruginascens]
MDDAHKVTITICGDGGCGKSSITLRLVRSQWTHEYDPTIEDSYTLTRTIDGQTYHLSLTDTAGQEEYRGMWASSNLRSDAFLLVYDITSSSSLEQLGYFNDLIDMEAETRLDAWETRREGKEGVPGGWIRPVKIVAGNKCDLQESRQIPAQVGLEWARKRGCGFMETSARNTVNIEETFALIVRRVVEARRQAAGLSAEIDNAASHARKQSVADSGYVGTRRAMTAPLTPLPPGAEKDFRDGDPSGGRTAWWKSFSRRFMCW